MYAIKRGSAPKVKSLLQKRFAEGIPDALAADPADLTFKVAGYHHAVSKPILSAIGKILIKPRFSVRRWKSG
jgi:hypothetical protein